MIKKSEAIGLIRAEYSRLDYITGVCSLGIEIKLSSRLSRRLGYFSVSRKNLLSAPKLSIVISDRLLPYDEIFWDVVRHEYAHAAVYLKHPLEKHGHDAVWKSMCRLVGCQPRATRKTPLPTDNPAAGYRYIVKCMNCGTKAGYKKEVKAVKIAEGKLPGRLICRVCRGSAFSCERL